MKNSCDEGWTGLATTFSTVITDKYLSQGRLTIDQIARNRNVFFDFVVIKNYTSRLCLFMLFGSK